jgi:transposase
MRGNQPFQGAMFSYISPEERVPQAHPLRKLRAVVDALLATMNREIDAMYAHRGRLTGPPEMLLKALLLQILFSIRSERQFCASYTNSSFRRNRRVAGSSVKRKDYFREGGFKTEVQHPGVQ